MTNQFKCNSQSIFFLTNNLHTKKKILNTIKVPLVQCRIQGEDPGIRTPPPPPETWRLFETEMLTPTGSYITFYLADFLVKRALHFATKLNSRDH